MTERVADLAATETRLRCPRCGYDVRFASDSRCSECGEVFDRQRLERTWWPWVHRREMGRVRAFFKTMVAVMFLPFRARDQTHGSLTVEDAWRFWWWCVLAVMPVVVGYATYFGWLLVWAGGGLSTTGLFGRREYFLYTFGLRPGSWFADDLIWPVFLSVVIPGVLPMAVVAAMGFTAGVVSGFFQSGRVRSAADRTSMAAMGVYQVAYVVLWVWGTLPILLSHAGGVSPLDSPMIWTGAIVLAGTLAAWTLFCQGRMYLLVVGRRGWRGWLGAVGYAGVTAVAAVGSVLLPLWTLGLARLMVESIF